MFVVERSLSPKIGHSICNLDYFYRTELRCILEGTSHMDSWAFWLLVFPVLLAAVLYFLGFFTVGLGFVSSASKTRNPRRRLIKLFVGICVILAPFLLIKFQHIRADIKADQREVQLANMERVHLAGRLPKRFVAVGGFQQTHIDLIKKESGMGQFPKTENDRLASAYRQFRRVEFCHSHSSGKMMSKKIQIPICKDLPQSIHAALNIKEPVLFFAEGSNTSYLMSNTHVGNMYEVRLITSTEDLLVDYYEDRILERSAGVTNPFSSGYKRDPDAPKLHIIDFIKRALERASR